VLSQFLPSLLTRKVNMTHLQTAKPSDFIVKICQRDCVTLRKFKSAEEFEQEVARFMKRHDVLHLATSRGDQPRCTAVGYKNIGTTMYILSEGGAKFQNLSANPRVAYSIASRIRRGRGFLKVRGLQVWGKAEVISQKEREKFQETLDLMGVTRSLKRRGVKGLPPFPYRIIKIEPEKMRYFNLSEGIYYVTWLKG